MRKIWESDPWYNLLRIYVDFATQRSYRRISSTGSLPTDGAVIISPNHTNTLLDALVVLQSRKEPTVFGARADIFKKPAVDRILRFLRILPMVRSRDGIREVLHNRESFEEVEDTLEHRIPFCIFSEGRHRPMHSLLPLQKGVARLAFASAEKQQTYIVPAGIDYSDFFHYRGTCDLKYGEPIDINRFLAERSGQTPAQVYSALLEELSARMKKLILYIPDDEHYEETWQAIQQQRRKKRPWKWPLAILTLPFFLLSALLTLPMWGTAEYLCKKKIKDHAFWNTARCMARVVGGPIMLIIWSILFFILLPVPIAIGLLVYFLVSYDIFYDWLNLVRE